MGHQPWPWPTICTSKCTVSPSTQKFRNKTPAAAFERGPRPLRALHCHGGGPTSRIDMTAGVAMTEGRGGGRQLVDHDLLLRRAGKAFVSARHLREVRQT